MKKLFLNVLILAITMNSFAQKQTFNVISFSIPKGWQQTQNEGGIQLSVTDKNTGAYAIAVITKVNPSTASAAENFTNDWNKLVKGTVQVNEEPAMQDPVKENGWDIISGGANYTDGATTGMATLLTATSTGQTMSVVLMTNSKEYQTDLVDFLNSLELSKPSKTEAGNSVPATGTESGKSSITGLWVDYTLETSGIINGIPQYTAGYRRKEYAFYSDGTYLFRVKQWLTVMKEILYIYETGTYSVSGNQLTINPKKGRGEWWSKKDNNTRLWGKLVKASSYKLEKVTYTFGINYFSGSQNYALSLKPGKATERDGGTINAPAGSYEFRYTFREKAGSLIDNPPGVKTGFENKSLSATPSPENNAPVANAVSSPLAGKTWEGSASEKFTGTGGSTGYNTGGFSTLQYRFNGDGTYRFISVRASHYTDTKTLEYESGTWLVNGNQLSITPAKGQNEEWSKVGKTSNGNSDVTNRAINETWGKKLKTIPRKLEKYIYPFSIEKNGDRQALVLHRNRRTEREGDGKISYLNETSPERSAKLPAGMK